MVHFSIGAGLRKERGIDVLRDPQVNKSTAFTEAERETLGLTGLLPSGIDSADVQVQRVMQQLGAKTTDLERYIYLTALLDGDETLFYKVLMSDPARFLPIVYDPTVGEACLKFGHIFRRQGVLLQRRYPRDRRGRACRVVERSARDWRQAL
jgi:malate dehydrogenase (oxaloacetate-decarboxylating)(NADP+)